MKLKAPWLFFFLSTPSPLSPLYLDPFSLVVAFCFICLFLYLVFP